MLSQIDWAAVTSTTEKKRHDSHPDRLIAGLLPVLPPCRRLSRPGAAVMHGIFPSAATSLSVGVCIVVNLRYADRRYAPDPCHITPLVCNLLLTAMKIRFKDNDPNTTRRHHHETFFTRHTCLFLLSTLSGCGYNTMQANEEAVIAAWGNVESSYQRRNDLIPIWSKWSRAMPHEADTLKAVTEARAKVGISSSAKRLSMIPQPLTNSSRIRVELSSALSRLMVVAERYPDLKANQNFRPAETAGRDGEPEQRSPERYNKLCRSSTPVSNLSQQHDQLNAVAPEA